MLHLAFINGIYELIDFDPSMNTGIYLSFAVLKYIVNFFYYLYELSLTINI